MHLDYSSVCSYSSECRNSSEYVWLLLAELARLTFVNICLQFLAFKGVTRISAGYFRIRILLFWREVCGLVVMRDVQFSSYGDFCGLLAITEWHNLEYDVGC